MPQRKDSSSADANWSLLRSDVLGGARRQLFMAFGGWLLVERFRL